MSQAIDRISHSCGTKQGLYANKYWVVAEFPLRTKERRIQYVCTDMYGNFKIVTGKQLLRYKIKRTHFKEVRCKEHYLYRTYTGMKTRCYDKNSKNYRWWGDRGIKVCERWLESFWFFVEDMGDRPAGYTLDRIDNDGHYTPENCKWSSIKEQCKNRRKNSGWAKKKCQ